jgi:hypothetical protein
VLGLLKDIGIDLDRFETAYDSGFFRRHLQLSELRSRTPRS